MGDSSFTQFCSTTTAHGFNYLNAPSKQVKTCWLVILVFGFVAGAVHLYTIINQYLAYDSHETVTTSSDVYPEFPAVTICDNSGISESSLEA